MTQELWAVETCTDCKGSGFAFQHIRYFDGPSEACETCGGATYQHKLLDFDTIYDRYYVTADRRFKEGLTYNELFWVVYGEKKEEE